MSGIRETTKRVGILHNTYLKEVDEDGCVLYKCGVVHEDYGELVTYNRKEIRKHMMKEHYNYRI
jgi:hypothetical protein